MIRLTRYQQQKHVWINPTHIATMETSQVKDGNGDIKSMYTDIKLVDNMMVRVDESDEVIMKMINSRDQVATLLHG